MELTLGVEHGERDPSVACRYPNNGLLRAITPQSLCRNLDVYPVKLTKDAISVDVSGNSRNQVKVVQNVLRLD